MPVVIALLSVSALGVASTTLDTSLTTDPDDAINPDWDRLPIGQGDAAGILEEMGDVDEEEEETGDGEGSETPEDGDAERGPGPPIGGPIGGDDPEEGPGDGGDEEGLGLGDGGDEEGPGGVGGDGGLADPEESTLFDRLLALLAAVLRAILPLAVLVAAVALGYRYRDRLRALLARLLAGTRDGSDGSSGSGGSSSRVDAWPGTEPSTDVDRAWVALVRRLAPENPETTTTGECRALARDRGFDEAAVEAIVTAFERVHYGGVAAAEEADRAREGLRRLGGGDP